METFIVIASLAVSSGIIFLAFKYPHTYRRVSSQLRELILVAWVAVGAWTSGVSDGIYSMTPYLQKEQLKEASRLMSENGEFMSDIMRGGVLVLASFLLIPPLRRLLKKDEKEESPE